MGTFNKKSGDYYGWRAYSNGNLFIQTTNHCNKALFITLISDSKIWFNSLSKIQALLGLRKAPFP